MMGDYRIIDLVADTLRQVTPTILLAANDKNAMNWLVDVPIVSDNYPGTGGLAGIEAGLALGQDLLVVAWDMPFVAPVLLEALKSAALEHDADVVVPASHSPHGFEPFCAFYSTRIRPALTRFLEAGGGPARDFVGQMARVSRLSAEQVARCGDATRLFFSVNTFEDLATARAMTAPAK